MTGGVSEMVAVRFPVAILLLLLTALSPPVSAGTGGGGGGPGGGPGQVMNTPSSGGRTGAGENGPSLEHLGRRSSGDMKSGGVRMELEPVAYRDGLLEVRYYANTHVGNLAEYDLMQLVSLHLADAVIRPHSIDRMRGHHASGLIRFRIPAPPARFTIVITGVPNAETREFTW